MATVFVLAGFGFKTAAVPFPFLVSGCLHGSADAGNGFSKRRAESRGLCDPDPLFFHGFSNVAGVDHWTTLSFVNWQHLVIVISIITMTLGNIAALRQDNIKRMLAYSSIAHAGYILMGVVVLTVQGLQSVLVYLITYLFMNLGAFLIVIEIYNRTGSFDLKDYRGLYRRSPFLTIAMTVFMLSLMGIPPFAGFFGKLYVFGAAVNRNLAWFAVVGALNSVVAVYYYARVIKTMIIEANEDTSRLCLPWSSHLMIWFLLLPTVGMMLFWGLIQQLAVTSTKLFPG